MKYLELPRHKLIIGPKQPAKGFLKTVSHKVDFVFENGVTDSMVVDSIERKSMDVVVIIPYFYNFITGKLFIYLKSCIRPALVTRKYIRQSAEHGQGNIWELPAGLIEPEEYNLTGVYQAAQRELEEEIGFKQPDGSFQFCGKSYYANVGMMAEQIFILKTAVDPKTIQIPTEDGSPLEKYSKIISITLDDALYYIDRGEIVDSKTILALYRFKISMGNK